MRPSRRLILVCALTAVLLPGCGIATGSGNIVTEVRDLRDFKSVSVREGLDLELEVRRGAEYAVTVSYDDNLLERIVTRISGDMLIVEFDGNATFAGGSDRVVTVVMPRLESLRASGGAEVRAAGAIRSYSVRASGGAAIHAGKLRATTVDVEASGGADVVVFASSTVTGDASGGANISVLGSPDSVEIATSGGAEVDG